MSCEERHEFSLPSEANLLAGALQQLAYDLRAEASERLIGRTVQGPDGRIGEVVGLDLCPAQGIGLRIAWRGQEGLLKKDSTVYGQQELGWWVPYDPADDED
jgi:hypothetical protein